MEFQRTLLQELKLSATCYPVITLVGPRQAGKTTLVKAAFPNKAYVSLEDPDIRDMALSDPRGFLAQYPEGAVLDEIQRAPRMLSYMQGLVDRTDRCGMFVLTGSHQRVLQQEIAQSLAGRTAVLHLMPLSLQEMGSLSRDKSVDDLLFDGGYPRVHKHRMHPVRFYRDYVHTYLERDVRWMINIRDLDAFRRFVSLCATRVGHTIDYTQWSNALGVSRHTLRGWLSILQASYVITTLPPYFDNLGKRIIKTPKLYFNDVGLVCYLLGIHKKEHIRHHPLRGWLFENLVVQEVLKHHWHLGQVPRCYFYRDNNQLEVDVLIQQAAGLMALEVKSSRTFHKCFLNNILKFQKRTHSPCKGCVVYAGEHETTVHHIKLVSIHHLTRLLDDPSI